LVILPIADPAVTHSHASMKGLGMNGDAMDANANMMLGRLLAEVANLREDFRRSEDKSDLSRSAVHRRMDDLVSQVGELKTDVATATEDIKEMKPITQDVQKWKLMGLGALGVVGLGGAALGVTLAGFFDQLLKFLRAG
jgi:hypothetical protein